MTIMTATEYIYVIANHKLYVIVSIRSMRNNVAIQKKFFVKYLVLDILFRGER